MTTWLFFGYFFLVTCSQYAVKSVRQATFIDSLGAEQLPWVYLLVALVSLPIIIVYSRLAETARPHRMIIAFSLVHALALAAFYRLLAIPAKPVAMVFYIWVTVAFGIAVSQLWSYAHFALDSRQARRLFAIIGAGGLLGAIPGGLLAIEISRRAGTRATLLGAAVVMLAAAGVVPLIERFLLDRIQHSIRALFRLLELCLPPDDARAAFRSLSSRHPAVRAQALEYLDNTLAAGLRRDVFAVIDDEPVDEKLRRVPIFGGRIQDRVATLARLLAADLAESSDRTGLVVAALYELTCSGDPGQLAPTVAALARQSFSEVVRETAEWTAGRMQSPQHDAPHDAVGAAGDRATGREELTMAPLTQIEMVLVLQ